MSIPLHRHFNDGVYRGHGSPQPCKRCILEQAAPDLLTSLRFLVEAADTEPGMNIYRAHIEKAKEVIAKIECE